MKLSSIPLLLGATLAFIETGINFWWWIRLVLQPYPYPYPLGEIAEIIAWTMFTPLSAVYFVWGFFRMERDRWIHKWGFW